jgi:hypothetical protein
MRALKLLRRNEYTHELRLENAGYCFGGGKNDAPDAPDYGPVANASVESAQIARELGEKQLAESKRQYDTNAEALRPVVEGQVKLQQQAYEQGNKNYEALDKEGRPIQKQMADYAMGAGLSDAHQKQVDEAADLALADARTGTTQQNNQLVRTGLRYGWSPERLATMAGNQAVAGAQGQVAAANAARTQTKDKQWAKMGDVYNTYAGLGSSAPAFYNAGTSAGGTASNVMLGNSGQLINGMTASNGTTMNGQTLKMNGLGSVMNAQANVYSAGQGGSNPLMGLAGAALGGWAQGGFKTSDRRVKENIIEVGTYSNGLPKYEFNYTGDPVRYRGVMAQDVEPLFPDAVIRTVDGVLAVNYRALGLEMERV